MWKDEPITDKQKRYIEEMQEFSEYPLPQFKGKTKGDAHDYIALWSKRAHESTWAIEHGYD